MNNNSTPQQTWLRMIKEIIAGLWRSRLWLNVPSEPSSSMKIHNDFFGINIATSTDSSCDDYIIQALQELGIKHIRMDFSYDSFDSHGERLLHHILANDIDVMLDIFHPKNDASVMHIEPLAMQRWQQFVSRVFDAYHDTVAVFEIGNTSNRKTWSGFQPLSYLKAWDIARPLADRYTLTLAGPNVSDFEPVYNIAYLKEMQRSHSVPTIHTDNLFVERVIEPEAYDHRVLGRWATNLLRLNLIKKARIIDLIGKRLGCSQTFCTYTDWTVKRLDRRNLDPEQKQADYLTRYLILAAASGALDRVYWGPLICSRDGIIDCGSDWQSYPKIDSVAYYQCVRGETSAFRKRPAFYALKYLLTNLSNAHCIQAVSADNGINHFIFTNSQQQEIHITWCRDGRAMPLTQLYPAGLHDAVFYTQLGKKCTENPLCITEQPLFIHFAPDTTMSRPQPEFISKLADLTLENIAAPAPSTSKKQFTLFQNEKWTGAIIVDPSCSADEMGEKLLPESIEKQPISKVLRDTRNKIWNIETSTGTITIKLNRAQGIKKFTYRFLDSKAKRHWNNAITMLRNGINTPQPIAFFERHQRKGIAHNYYITQFLENAFSARDVFTSINNGKSHCRGIEHNELLKVIGQAVCQMHNMGILHRDLSSGNILLIINNAEVKPYFIDIGRARILKKLTTRQRLIDLMRICFKLPRSEREKLIGFYNAHLGGEVASWWRWAVRYYIFKHRSKRFIKGKFKSKK